MSARGLVDDVMVDAAVAECRRWGLLEESEFRADNDAQESVLRCALEAALAARHLDDTTAARTAGPSDAQVEAAAKAIHSWDIVGRPERFGWDELTPHNREEFRGEARAALSAARAAA